MHLPRSRTFLAAVCLCCAASCQSTRTEPALAIIRSQAEAAALATAPGSVIIDGSLEKRDARWVWAFQAVSPGLASPRELLVNARTGDAILPKSVLAQQNTEVAP